jgi:hypothetical protein
VVSSGDDSYDHPTIASGTNHTSINISTKHSNGNTPQAKIRVTWRQFTAERYGTTLAEQQSHEC